MASIKKNNMQSAMAKEYREIRLLGFEGRLGTEQEKKKRSAMFQTKTKARNCTWARRSGNEQSSVGEVRNTGAEGQEKLKQQSVSYAFKKYNEKRDQRPGSFFG